MRFLEFLFVSVFLPLCAAGLAQQHAATPSLASQQTPATTYDTAAALPKDRNAAWAMLRAANGLTGDGMQPWVMEGHYKLPGRDGKADESGTIEMVWAATANWRVTYGEGMATTTEWVTPGGRYSELGKPDGLAYPRTLMTDIFDDPLQGVPTQAPRFSNTQKVIGIELNCFGNGHHVNVSPQPGHDSKMFCTMPKQPILRLIEGWDDYDIFFNKISGFEHHPVPLQVLTIAQDGLLFELDVDTLTKATPEQLGTLKPSANATKEDWIIATPGIILTPLNLQATMYPSSLSSPMQGFVRLSIAIGKDGRVTPLNVLASSNPVLTRAALDEVRQWRYKPYVQNGVPQTVHVNVVINYGVTLN
jgi:TonB family protein